MLKRFFVLILALCCAFSFICQPVAATGTEAFLTLLEIGMSVAGAFGITFPAPSGYEAFGNLLHDSVIEVPDIGEAWWNKSLQGNILIASADEAIKQCLRVSAAKAADAMPESHPDNRYVLSPSCYTLTRDGRIDNDYRTKTFDCVTSSNSPIFLLQCCWNNYGFYFGIYLVSKDTFTVNGSSASWDTNGYYCRTIVNSSENSKTEDQLVGFEKLNTTLSNYIPQFLNSFSNVSSAGGATAAYPTYGYDGVSLPDIDLTQKNLIGADGKSTVSDLVDQLQSGAITWEDYIGTVAPGQTATITLTDENGVAVTYTLTNTGVGTRVDSVPDVSEATEPAVVPGTGELTGTLADTEAKSFLDSLTDTIGNTFADVIAGVKAIPEVISDVIAEVKAIPAAIADTFANLKPSGDVDHFTLDLRKYFPFCIPFDMYDFVKCLNAAPEAPVIDWKLQLPGGGTYDMQIDLSVFDPVASLLRRLELLLFCVGLAVKTRDLIKG